MASETTEIVISGVGVGLPGKDKEVFAEDNIQRLLGGESFISQVDQRKIDSQKRQNIVQKRRIQGNIELQQLKSEDDLVKLAGEAGEFDLIKEYGVGEGLIDGWEITTQLAIAAALEALKDAFIPLVKEGSKLSLPTEYINDTGIIFASTFPSANTFLQEQSKYHEQRLFNEKSAIAEKLRDQFGSEAEEIINSFLPQNSPEYIFDRKYLLKAIPIQSGNVAQVIQAKGPNTGINSACASTTQAIALAEDWIRVGRAKRVIVVAADDPTNETTFGWIATGFLAAGAATTEKDVNRGAKPFDKSRSGMILGMGAVGIVIETREEVEARGVNPIVEIIGSHVANSAYHGTRMNPDDVKRNFKQFMSNVTSKSGIQISEISSCLYMSHETFTPPQGNGARTEIEALIEVFGQRISEITIGNTKGLTAHPMGVSIEDIATVKALQYGKLPPVANLETPEFDLKFSRGEKETFQYAIRFAAGFGSQLVYLLLRNLHVKDRVTHRFSEWLSKNGLNSELEFQGKTLIVSQR
ncbi:MAG: beta-ketoacyl synthase N-terminal-like domain-containing protein [Candidatus Kariarchaeaceae archaeon]